MPTSTPSQNQQPGTQTPVTPPQPNPPTVTPGQPPSGPSGQPTPGQPSTSPPQQGGGFGVGIGRFVLSPNANDVIDPARNAGDKFAAPKPDNRLFFSSDDLASLDIALDQALVLQAEILIETNGVPEVLSTQVLSGNVSAPSANQLAERIIGDWSFEPTYMAGGAVPRVYNVELNLSPRSE